MKITHVNELYFSRAGKPKFMQQLELAKQRGFIVEIEQANEKNQTILVKTRVNHIVVGIWQESDDIQPCGGWIQYSYFEKE